jgi:hypothetical protein
MTKNHVDLGNLLISHEYEFKKVSPEGHKVISFEENMYIFSVRVSSWAIPAIYGGN